MPDQALASDEAKQDTLVIALVKRVQDLADGNGVTAADVTPTAATRTDHPVTLRLTATLGWRSESTVTYGATRPAGSHHMADDADAQAALTKACQSEIGSIAEADARLQALAKDPLTSFESFRGGDLRELSHRFHCHEVCSRCSGHCGWECSACTNGKVRCNRHGYDRRITCGVCGGTGSFSRTDNNHNYVRVTCSGCAGECKVPCPSCDYLGELLCPSCYGSNWHHCSDCKRTGWFTRSYRSWATANTERSWVFRQDADGAFKNLAATLPIEKVPRTHALSWAKGDGTTAPFMARLQLSCILPSVTTSIACGPTSVSLHAVGVQNTLRAMPPFIDKLLIADSTASADAEWSPHEAVEAAQRSRVGRQILAITSSRAKTTPAQVSAEYQGAVSESFVEEWRKTLQKAYNGLARDVVSRTWRIWGPLAAITVAGMAAVGLPGNLIARLPVFARPESDYAAQGLIHLGLVGMPLGAAWLTAAIKGRRAVRQTAGSDAKRFPRQGFRPLPWAIAALAAYALLGSFDNDAPLVPILPQPVLDAGPYPTNDNPYRLLPPSDKPRLRYIPYAPPLGLTPQNVDGERLRHKLAALGIPPGALTTQGLPQPGPDYNRPTDMASPNRPEIRALLGPDGNYLHVIEAALRDRVRLETPANASPAAAAPNIVRGRLTPNDLRLLRLAAGRAAASPKASLGWVSANGTLRGRVAALRAPRGSDRCTDFEVDFEFNGAAVALLPYQVLCEAAGQWSPD